MNSDTTCGAARPEGWFARIAVGLPWVWALLVGIVAFALHLKFYPIGDLDADTDFYGDLVIGAQQLARGRLTALNYPYKGPLFSFVLVPVHAVIGDWYESAVVVNIVCAVSSLIVLHHLLSRVYTHQVAVWGVALVSTLPEFFLLAHGTQTDLLFLGLVTGALVPICSGAGSLWPIALAGALAGLAFLTRYNGAVVPIVTTVALVAVNPSRLPRGRRLCLAAIHLGAFFAVVAPWLALSHSQTGMLLYTKNAQNLVAGLYDPVEWRDLMQGQHLRPLREILAYAPSHAAKNLSMNSVKHARRDLTELLGIPTAALALLGLVGVLLHRANASQWSLYVFGITYFLTLAPIFYSPRFSLPIAPVYVAAGVAFILGALGPARPGAIRIRAPSWLWRPRPQMVARWITAAFLIACTAAGVARIVAKERERIARRPLSLLPAIQALRQHAAVAGHGAVLARKGHIAFHAGLDYVQYPMAIWSLKDLLAFARDHGVRYISYGFVEFELQPDLRFLGILDSIPGTRDIYRRDGERVFEIMDYMPGVSDSLEFTMLLANATAAARRRESDLEAEACNMVAKYFWERNRPAEGAQWLTRAVTLTADALPGSRSAHIATTCRLNLGRVLLMIGRTTDARLETLQVLNYFERWGSRNDRAETLLLLAAIDENQHDVASAERHLRSARTLFSRAADQARVDSIVQSLPSASRP